MGALISIINFLIKAPHSHNFVAKHQNESNYWAYNWYSEQYHLEIAELQILDLFDLTLALKTLQKFDSLWGELAEREETPGGIVMAYFMNCLFWNVLHILIYYCCEGRILKFKGTNSISLIHNIDLVKEWEGLLYYHKNVAIFYWIYIILENKLSCWEK